MKKKVIECFRCLYRARREVFADDDYALNAAREKIRSEFEKHRNETDQQKIEELVNFGLEAAKILRTSVIQARLTPKGTYKLRIRKENQFDNTPKVSEPKKEDS